MWNMLPKLCLLNSIKSISLIQAITKRNPLFVSYYNIEKRQNSHHQYVKSQQSYFGKELVGEINKLSLKRNLGDFCQSKKFKDFCTENNLNDLLLFEMILHFQQYCLNVDNLPIELYIALSDLSKGKGNEQVISTYFLEHAKQTFPEEFYTEDLQKISDLRCPTNWYPKARQKKRQIIFHSGPTNSGKTYEAMQRFLNAKSGIYCGPLKLLAAEVYNKSNNLSRPCDLLTGEERKFVNFDKTPCSHIACTIEMAPLDREFQVAIIDEIQFIRDVERGRAWTRGLLGICADEIHVCGEASAGDLLKRICEITGESIEVHEYDRFTKLIVEETALKTLANVKAGDCIVCFRKSDIFYVSRELNKRGTDVAVIYGSLPPDVKLEQANKFNDPNHHCKVLVATDAIGTGVNLCIRRIIFFSLLKQSINDEGEKVIDVISVSSALQIAGRAGRYGTQFEQGYVTTFRQSDMPILNYLMSHQPEPIMRAGLAPTISQIEKYAEYLPNSTLSSILDVFVVLTTVDDLYFLCDFESIKSLDEIIQHIPIGIRDRYTFCCAPINPQKTFVTEMFVMFVQKYAKNERISLDWITTNVNYPFVAPVTIDKLEFLECMHETINCYLWLSHRFGNHFSHREEIVNYQKELNRAIQEGVDQIKKSVEGPCQDGTERMFSNDQRSLSSRLIKQGRLTPQMLETLKNEN